MNYDRVSIGGAEFQGYTIELPHAKLLIIRGNGGFLACGYVNQAACEKFGDAAAFVSGVASYDDMLAAAVKAVTPEAAKLGAEPGMTGREVLLKFARQGL